MPIVFYQMEIMQAPNKRLKRMEKNVVNRIEKTRKNSLITSFDFVHWQHWNRFQVAEEMCFE